MYSSPVLCVLATLVVISSSQNVSRRDLGRLKNVVAALSRQVMLQQLATEEKIRADGGSGIKQIRVNGIGPESYFANTHTGGSMASIHDHSNNKNMLGQGEGQFVLNGVEFRTRHNDYLLRMPSTTSSKYNLLQELPYPPVPKAVTDKPTVQEQIEEMRLWFKAWKEQDYSVRDYRPHFRAILCYLEGAWTTKTDKIEEPFFSDRHALDADTWFDLQEKVRFTAYTGRKSLEENYAYLPTTIINITAAGMPVYAQWNYRMLCHPVSQNLPTSYLKPVEDLSAMMLKRKNVRELASTRAARFKVVGPKDKKRARGTYLDTLMSQVPGKNNYVANIADNSFGMVFKDPYSKNDSALNVGYYHRYYKAKKDAMGLTYGKRGYSDPNVFVAETTHSKIAPMYLRQCQKGKCYESTKRVSYAIPLEIVYLTPLTRWNPFGLDQKKGNEKDIVTGKGKRNGKFRKDLAYNGTFRNIFYRTPTEFFSGGEVGVDPADTVKGSVGVLDPEENVRRVSASGIRIFLPKIPGVGVLRTRYPIMPVHGESSSVWKELDALKDIVMKLRSSQKYLTEKFDVQASSSTSKGKSSRQNRPTPKPAPEPATEEAGLTLVMSTATAMPPGEHSHTIELTEEEIDLLKQGQAVDAISSEDNGHAHSVTVKYYNNRYHVTSCDDSTVPCWDGHTACLMTPAEDTCPAERPKTSSRPASVTVTRGSPSRANANKRPKAQVKTSSASPSSSPLSPSSSSSTLIESPAAAKLFSDTGRSTDQIDVTLSPLDQTTYTFMNHFNQHLNAGLPVNTGPILARIFGRYFKP